MTLTPPSPLSLSLSLSLSLYSPLPNTPLFAQEYIKDEQKNLKRELIHAKEEVKRIQSVPLVIGQFLEMIDQNR